MKYTDSDYARQRLNSTVVRIGEDPIYLISEGGWEYRAIRLKDGKDSTINIRKVDLNLNPVPLGYVNYGQEAYYLSRKPVRRWKQGLGEESLSVISHMAKKAIIPRGGIIASPALAYCIENKYPSIQKCYKKINSGLVNSMSFSRDFALGWKKELILLYYKGKEIGLFSKNGLNLNKNYSFLKEALEEAIQ